MAYIRILECPQFKIELIENTFIKFETNYLILII